MRWKLKPQPEHGDRRIVRMFALFPQRIGNTRIWLEEYDKIQEFYIGWGSYGWHTVKRRKL